MHAIILSQSHWIIKESLLYFHSEPKDRLGKKVTPFHSLGDESSVLSGSTVLVWQETVETLDVTGHFLHHSMPLCAFIRLNRFLLIKKEEKEKQGKTVSLWLLRPTKSYLQGSGS